MSNEPAPKALYLIPHDHEEDETQHQEYWEGATWSEDNDDGAVKYIRADLASLTPEAQGAAPLDQLDIRFVREGMRPGATTEDRWQAQAAIDRIVSAASKELAYAIQIATYGVRKFADAPNWESLDTMMGVLSQIDNLLAGTPAVPAPAPTLDLDALAMVLLDRAVKAENLSPNEDSSFWYPWSECNEACRDDWRREAQELLAAVEAKKRVPSPLNPSEGEV